MLRLTSALTGALALTALLACGAAQAARDACPQAADIVRAVYPNAPAPGADGRVRLGQDNLVVQISDAEFGAPFAVTCKAWPANPNLLLAAIPLMQDGPDDADGHDGDLRILVLDRATLRILHDLQLAGLMSDDAVRLSNVSFDTARYDVAPGRRAFGLRISREGSSRANPYSETSLRLFDIGAQRLDMLLDGLIVDGSGGEWDTNCAGEFTERSVSLAMGEAQTQGLRDLVATESYESSRSAVQHGDCVEKTLDKGKTTHTLKFDGRRYQIPKALRSMDREPAE